MVKYTTVNPSKIYSNRSKSRTKPNFNFWQSSCITEIRKETSHEETTRLHSRILCLCLACQLVLEVWQVLFWGVVFIFAGWFAFRIIKIKKDWR